MASTSVLADGNPENNAHTQAKILQAKTLRWPPDPWFPLPNVKASLSGPVLSAKINVGPAGQENSKNKS